MKPAFDLRWSMKDYFFDRPEVQRRVDDATRKELSKAGAFIRQRAKHSLRRRKRTSEPGETPSIHIRDPVATLRNIWFVYDPDAKSVIVGPIGLDGSSQPVPSLMEFGGTSRVFEASPIPHGNRWIPVGKRPPRWAKRTRTRRAKYKARPFMGPSLDKEIEAGKISSVWAGAVKG